MVKVFNEEYRKELLEKRKYYSEHPEEAKKACLKKDDEYRPVGKKPQKQ